MDTAKDVINYFGGVGKTAAALGVSSQAVSQWRGRIPLGRAWQIEVLSNGRFKAATLPVGPREVETTD